MPGVMVCFRKQAQSTAHIVDLAREPSGVLHVNVMRSERSNMPPQHTSI